MTVGQKQELFSRLLPELLDEAHAQGFQVRLRELWRTKEQAEIYVRQGIGIVNSLHRKGLAIDLVLFRDGRPLWATRHYLLLGEFWEDLDDLCCWGGRFNDAGHFSLTHGGVK